MQEESFNNPQYDDLAYVFNKDQATRARLETFVDIESNVPKHFNESVILGDSHDVNVSMISSQGVDMSPDEMLGTRTGQTT